MAANFKSSKNSLFNSVKNSEDGSATLESIALIFVFVVLMSFTFGAFGIIHSGILFSIGARNYAFETLRNRSNYVYFRDEGQDLSHYYNAGYRIHGLNDGKDGSNSTPEWAADSRSLSQFFPSGQSEQINNSGGYHAQLREPARAIRENRQVNPVWIKTVYGICLNATCEGRQR